MMSTKKSFSHANPAMSFISSPILENEQIKDQELETRNISQEDLCYELALFSLEKAFGEKGKNVSKKNLKLSPKLARLFAGYLSTSGKDFSNNKSLFASLAAEAVGAKKISDNDITGP